MVGRSNWVFWLVGFCEFACLIVGINGWPMEHHVASLPGQPKVNFKQFAGYIDIDDTNGRSLFYYFVEAEEDSNLKPLTLWLNGGPGCSSVGGGAFTELGPFYPRGDGRGLRINSKSWNKGSQILFAHQTLKSTFTWYLNFLIISSRCSLVSNLLFIESPAGVGWSYSNTTSDYTTGDAKTANDMLTFMLKWYEKFPELQLRDLFLTGESYAGHYIPQLAIALMDYNAQSTGFKFNIKGVADITYHN
ncbi:hypothetical protein V2J09_019723 [Rumex salicifolius]